MEDDLAVFYVDITPNVAEGGQRFFSALARYVLPLIVIAIIYGTYHFAPETHAVIMHPHVGVLEYTIGAVLLAAFILSLNLLFLPDVKQAGGLRWWVAAYAAGVFYFMGEDLNWGQYMFGLEVPEYFLERNRENEINLHNISSWFNQKPRWAVEIWVLVAGVLVAAGWNWPKRATAHFVPDVLWPGRETLPIALMAVLIVLPYRGYDIVQSQAGLEQLNHVRVSEVQEFCIAWFMMLYVWYLGHRIKYGRDYWSEGAR